MQVLSKISNKETFLDFISIFNISTIGLLHLSFHEKVHSLYIPEWPYKKHLGARYPYYVILLWEHLYLFLTPQKFPHDTSMDYHTDWMITLTEDMSFIIFIL